MRNLASAKSRGDIGACIGCDQFDLTDPVRFPILRAGLTREQANSLIAVSIVTRTEPDGRTVTVENKHRTLFSVMLCTGARPL